MEQLQTYQHSNHRGAKQEDKEQKTENLLKKIMKENFHNLVKDIEYKPRKHRESQTSWTQRGPHQDTS